MTLNYRTFLNLVIRKRRGREREGRGEGGREGRGEGGGREGRGRREEREGGIICIVEGRRWRV